VVFLVFVRNLKTLVLVDVLGIGTVQEQHYISEVLQTTTITHLYVSEFTISHLYVSEFTIDRREMFT
jgi:hypothetical protein